VFKSIRLVMAFLLFVVINLPACSAIPVTKEENKELPPVLKQDELVRPYIQIGRIQIVREVYGMDYVLEPNLYDWAINSLREEAYKMNADAVILPEFTSRKITIVVFPAFPSTEYRASATAIKFQ